jgi:hypothetical protein
MLVFPRMVSTKSGFVSSISAKNVAIGESLSTISGSVSTRAFQQKAFHQFSKVLLTVGG